MTAAGTWNKGLLFTWAPGSGGQRWRASFLHSFQEERHSQAACSGTGIKREAHRWFLNEGQNLGAL